MHGCSLPGLSRNNDYWGMLGKMVRREKSANMQLQQRPQLTLMGHSGAGWVLTGSQVEARVQATVPLHWLVTRYGLTLMRGHNLRQNPPGSSGDECLCPEEESRCYIQHLLDPLCICLFMSTHPSPTYSLVSPLPVLSLISIPKPFICQDNGVIMVDFDWKRVTPWESLEGYSCSEQGE